MSSIRPTKITTVSPSIFHDIELSATNVYVYRPIHSWFLEQNVVDNDNHTPSFTYPFYNKPVVVDTNTNYTAYAPYGKFTLTPIITSIAAKNDIAITIHDPSYAGDLVITQSLSTDSDMTYTAPISTALLSNVSSYRSATINTLILNNYNTEYRVDNLVWNAANNIVSNTYKSNAGALPNITIDYRIASNTLYSVYTFNGNTIGQRFTDRWKILSYCIPDIYPVVYNDILTNVTNITGTTDGNGEATLFSYPLSSLGTLSDITVSARDTVIKYSVISLYNSNSTSFISYDKVAIGSDTLILSGSVVGTSFNATISGDKKWTYSGYIIDRDSFNDNVNSYISVNNASPISDITLDNSACVENYNQYGSQWVVFANDSASSNIEINKHIAVWAPIDNIVYSSSMQGEKLLTGNINSSVERLKNDGIGLRLNSGPNACDIRGFRLGFDSNVPTTVKSWQNYNTATTTSINTIDTIPRTSSNAVVWDIDYNIANTDQTCKRRIYSAWNNAEVISTIRDIDTTGSTDVYYTVSHGVSSNNSTVKLNASAISTATTIGYRTLINNVSSFVVSDNNTIVIDVSNYDDNMWTVYCSSNNIFFLATVNSNKDVAVIDYICTTDPISAFSLAVSSTNNNTYSLVYDYIVDNTLTWNITGYRIDSRNSTKLRNNLTTGIPRNILSIPVSGNPAKFSNTWWLKYSLHSIPGIYQTHLLDATWDDIVHRTALHETHINTTTSSVCSYNVLNDVIILPSKNSTTLQLNASAGTSVDNSVLYEGWDIYGFNYTAVIDTISTKLSSVAYVNDTQSFDYIFSHPGDYSVTISITSNDSVVQSTTYTDYLTIIDIPATPSIIATLSSIDSITNQFTAVSGLSALSYYDTNIVSISSSPANSIYFTTLATRPGSFPIGEIHIDFGDDTGLTKINKTEVGLMLLSDNTTAYTLSSYQLGIINSNDPREYYFKHVFSSAIDTYTVSISCFNYDSRTLATDSITISGLQSIDNKVKRLINTASVNNNDMVYTILVEEND